MACQMVVSRLAEIRFVDPNTDIVLSNENVPYGSKLYFKHDDLVKKGDLICRWDPFNAVIVSEYAGVIRLRDVIDSVTYKTETDDATGLTERIIIDSKDKNRIPTCDIVRSGAHKSVIQVGTILLTFLEHTTSLWEVTWSRKWKTVRKSPLVPPLSRYLVP